MADINQLFREAMDASLHQTEIRGECREALNRILEEKGKLSFLPENGLFPGEKMSKEKYLHEAALLDSVSVSINDGGYVRATGVVLALSYDRKRGSVVVHGFLPFSGKGGEERPFEVDADDVVDAERLLQFALDCLGETEENAE